MARCVAAYFLDVGQGDCTFVVGPTGEDPAPVLVDCADAYVAERFVVDHKIKSLSAIVASHLDDDHVRGLLEFIKGFLERGGSIGRVFLGLDRVPRGLSRSANDLISAILVWAKAGEFALGEPVTTGQSNVVAQGAGWRVEIVLPTYLSVLETNRRGRHDPNAFSAVVRVQVGSSAILIGADAPLHSWEQLALPLRRAMVVRTPHHGGGLGRPAGVSLPGLYESIQADQAMISVGTTNSYGHPTGEHVLAALRGGACRVVCTQLTTQCVPRLDKVRKRAVDNLGEVTFPYRHRHPPGDRRFAKRGEVPCAGSIVASCDFAGNICVLPEPGGWHSKEISRYAKRLCR